MLGFDAWFTLGLTTLFWFVYKELKVKAFLRKSKDSQPSKYELCLSEIDRLEKLNDKLEEDYFKICNGEQTWYGVCPCKEHRLSGLNANLLKEIERKGEIFTGQSGIVGPKTLEAVTKHWEKQIASSFTTILSDGLEIKYIGRD